MLLQLLAAHIAKLGLGFEIVFDLILLIARTTADMNNTCFVSSKRLGDISTLTAIDIPVLVLPVKAV